ncbi:multiheme c-type cytochrome [Acidobacteriota bacterium]
MLLNEDQFKDKTKMKNQVRFKTSAHRSRSIAYFLLIGIFLWLIGHQLVPGQEQGQEVEKWTVETHDRTNFPLTGRHRTVSCRECHLNKVFEGTPTACEVCHWERRQDDRYQLRLGNHCGDCHTTFAWKNVSPNKWNHLAATGYALEGVHRTLDCVECHGESGFVMNKIDCFSCHEEDYRETREPDHVSAGFPTQCQLCHFNTHSWQGAKFSHDGFILRGQHKITGCQECHSSGIYKGLPSDCVDCHLDDYNATEDPNHRELGFPTDCELCHRSNANTWENARFNHSAFPLKGNHRTTLCADCHTEGQYEGIPSDCVDCHLQDYNEAQDPDHRRLDFPTDCEQCHGTNANTWENANFPHTAFPLKGQHKVIQCSECHINGQYEGLSSECVSCHLDDYNETKDPDHKELGFSTDCEQCHGTNANSWDNADFSHSGFPLKGQHKVIDCSDCHVNGQYEGLSTECASCHLDDYNRTADPNHRDAGFPTDCEQCHGTNANTWEDAAFDHNSVWALQGAHANLDCTSCHNQGYDLPQDCYGCHAQDYDSTRNPDHVSAGFPADCELCHLPSHVSWTQAVFNHQFPINSGKHSQWDCIDCHLTSNYREFSCIDCHAHQRTRMNNEHRKVDGYSYNSQACYSCHPDGRD